MLFKVKAFLSCQKGSTSIEYALIASMVSVAIIAGATSIGTSSTVTLNRVADEMG